MTTVLVHGWCMADIGEHGVICHGVEPRRGGILHGFTGLFIHET